LCFSNATEQAICTLPGGVEVEMVRPIGAGMTSSIWAVEVGGASYAMKASEVRHCCDGHSWTEYQIVNRLRAADSTLNIAATPPGLSYYDFDGVRSLGDFCFFFVENLADSITLRRLNGLLFHHKMRRHDTALWMDAFDRVDSSPLRFVLNCFAAIWRILDALSAMDLHYNDLNWGNIMVSTVDHKCYLIDFGFVLHLDDHYLLSPLPHGHHRRNISCVYTRCSAATYHSLYGIDQRLGSGVTDGDELRESARIASKYEIASILLHSLVELCVEMDRHSLTAVETVDELRELNRYFFAPKDDGKLPGQRMGGLERFQRAWCLRQRIVTLLSSKQHDLQCLSAVDEQSRSELMAMLTLYDADTAYLSASICNAVDGEQEVEDEREEDLWEQWDTEQVLQFMLKVGDGALSKYEQSMRAELFGAEIRGRDLIDFEIGDIKELGVTVFADRKMLQRAILNVTRN